VNLKVKILDVGAGPRKLPGSVSIDIIAENGPDILHNLDSFPWPIKDNEFDVVHCAHCLEHLSDPIKAVEEMYRVAKPGATIRVIVPHYSGHTAWGNPEHKRAFGAKWFDYFTLDEFRPISRSHLQFKIISIKFRWASVNPEKVYTPLVKLFSPLIKGLNEFLSFFANLSVEVCEKIWCYWVGGFGEIQFELRAEKTGVKNEK
jgi:SAM-dependent methyltransferase